MSNDNCSASIFPALDAADCYISSATEEIFITFTGVIQSCAGAVNVKALTDYATSLLVYNVWGTLLFIFLFCAAIPLAACVCCSCCDVRDGHYSLGYRACGCRGYLLPTVSFSLNWLSLACLAISVPFALHRFGGYVGDWACMTSAALDTGSQLAGEVQNISNMVFQLISSDINSTVTTIDKLLREVAVLVDDINSTVGGMETALFNGCETITSSAAYQALAAGLGGGAQPLDCTALNEFSSGVVQEVSQVESVITEARTELSSIHVSAEQELSTVQSDVNSYISSAEQRIDQARDDVFVSTTITLNQPFPPFIPDVGTYTLPGITNEVTNQLLVLGTALAALTLLGTTLWLLGLLLLACVQCQIENSRARLRRHPVVCTRIISSTDASVVAVGRTTTATAGGSSRGGLTESLLVEDESSLTPGPRGNRCMGCCGRSLMRGGCAFGYCGAFVMSIVSIVTLTVAPVLSGVATTYYVAPEHLDVVVNTLVDARVISNISASLVRALEAGQRSGVLVAVAVGGRGGGEVDLCGGVSVSCMCESWCAS
jgi:hypothetical protein